MNNNTAYPRTLRTQPFFLYPSHRRHCRKVDRLVGGNREGDEISEDCTEANDKKDCLLIYGGKEIVPLEKSLPNPPAEDPELDEYQKLTKKLNGYFIAKKNKHHTQDIYLTRCVLPVERALLCT